MHPKDVEEMANSVDPDQEQSDLGLHCLPRPSCPKSYVADTHLNHLTEAILMIIHNIMYLEWKKIIL